MGTKLLLVILTMFVVGCRPQSSDAKLPVATHDGRAGTACPGSSMYPAEQLCSPALIRLVTRGEDYDGRRIKVTGYLQNSGAVAFICPEPALCGEGDWSAAVQLADSDAITAMIQDGMLPSERVTVIGNFSATTRGSVGQVAGIFLTVDVAYLPRGP